MGKWLHIAFVAASVMLLVGCGGRVSSTDTNTNWLQECTDDGNCSEGLSCLCSVCTVACEDSAQCPSRRAPSCIPTDSCADAPAICDGNAGSDAASGGQSSLTSKSVVPAKDLSCADTYACALSESGEVECFGVDAPTPPAGIKFESIDAGLGRISPHTCGIRENDQIGQCWGSANVLDTPEAVAAVQPAPGAEFLSLRVGDAISCAIYARDGSAWCWGPAEDALSNSPAPYSHEDGPLSGLVLQSKHACAIRDSDGTVACWGEGAESLSMPESVAYRSVSVGDGTTCALRESDGEVQCVGMDWHGVPTPVGVSFASVSVGASHACGIRTSDGQAQCWGQNLSGQLDAPTGVAFTELCAGVELSCGIRATDGVVECWGLR